jgi:hypothetical protein
MPKKTKQTHNQALQLTQSPFETRISSFFLLLHHHTRQTKQEMTQQKTATHHHRLSLPSSLEWQTFIRTKDTTQLHNGATNFNKYCAWHRLVCGSCKCHRRFLHVNGVHPRHSSAARAVSLLSCHSDGAGSSSHQQHHHHRHQIKSHHIAFTQSSFAASTSTLIRATISTILHAVRSWRAQWCRMSAPRLMQAAWKRTKSISSSCRTFSSARRVANWSDLCAHCMMPAWSETVSHIKCRPSTTRRESEKL